MRVCVCMCVKGSEGERAAEGPKADCKRERRGGGQGQTRQTEKIAALFTVPLTHTHTLSLSHCPISLSLSFFSADADSVCVLVCTHVFVCVCVLVACLSARAFVTHCLSLGFLLPALPCLSCGCELKLSLSFSAARRGSPSVALFFPLARLPRLLRPACS